MATAIDLAKINDMINGDEGVYELKPLSSLIVNKPYIIEKLRVVNTRFGMSLLAILFDIENNVTFKSFLPQRVVKILSKDVIDNISSSHGQYTLTYLGKSSPTSPGIKPKSLLKIDAIIVWQ